jgi:lipopolysaccharide heptosyltransferase I
VLLIRPSALGDVCRTVPLAVSIKRAWPGCRLDWLVQDAFVEAVASHPDVDRVVPFPRKQIGRLARTLRVRSVRRWLDETFRAPGYDMVIDAQGLFRSGMFAWWTRAGQRIGFADAREFGWLGYTQRYGVDAPHTVDKMLGLIGAAGIPPVADLRLVAPERERAKIASDAELAGKRYAVVAPTSRWAGKRWPSERFAAVASGLLDRGYERVVLVGGAGERDQCGPLLELAGRERRIVDRIGATSVGGLLALIERSGLVIANDSAALHIAVGFDRPIVALFGPTRVDLVGPYHRERDVLQHLEPGETEKLDHKNHRAGRELMERVYVDEVLERVDRVGAERQASGREVLV